MASIGFSCVGIASSIGAVASSFTNKTPLQAGLVIGSMVTIVAGAALKRKKEMLFVEAVAALEEALEKAEERLEIEKIRAAASTN